MGMGLSTHRENIVILFEVGPAICFVEAPFR
jgi:hypothetical protein